MKKTLASLIIAASVVAQAASVNWSISSARKTYLWDSNNEKGNVTAYLVLSSDVDKITSPTETENFDTLLGKYAIDSVSLEGGAYSVEEREASSTSLKSGAGAPAYTFQLVLVDSQGKYALSTVSDPTYAYNPTTDDATSVPFGNTDVGAAAQAGGTNWGEKPVYGGGQGDIPEPATGALALAGVALLFKRRRA